jgi:hypothetical protein
MKQETKLTGIVIARRGKNILQVIIGIIMACIGGFALLAAIFVLMGGGGVSLLAPYLVIGVILLPGGILIARPAHRLVEAPIDDDIQAAVTALQAVEQNRQSFKEKIAAAAERSSKPQSEGEVQRDLPPVPHWTPPKK